MQTARTPTAAPPRTGLDELDVIVAVHREPPWMVESQRAALGAVLGPDWRGGALVVEDGARGPTARAARAALAAQHPLAHRTVLRLGRRMGAAAACDVALAEGTGEYAALLDPRVRPEPGALQHLITALDDDEPDALWVAPAAPGAVVVRRAEFLALGAFDPALRPAAAIADAGDRARQAGWQLLVLPEARVRRVEAPSARAPGPRLRTAPRAEWSAERLAIWLRRTRLAAERVDLP